MDIVKIASETIEGLFNMRLALPVALVRALTEGLDEVLRKWVSMQSVHALYTGTQCFASLHMLASDPCLHMIGVLHAVLFRYNRDCQ